MKKLLTIFFTLFLYLSLQGSSFFSGNNIGDPSNRVGVYSMGMGNSGMAYYDHFNIHPLNHSLSAGIDSTRIYASAIGDYLSFDNGDNSGLHISYSIPSFQFLIPVKGGIKIGLQYNTLYHNNINVKLAKTKLKNDSVYYETDLEKNGSLNTGELFFSYSVKNKVFLGLSLMSYFGSNEWKRVYSFSDDYYSDHYTKNISEYSGYNFTFSSTVFLNEKTSFAFYYTPEKDITNNEKSQTKYHEEFFSRESDITLGQRLGLGISYKLKKRLVSNMDFNFEDKMKNKYEDYSASLLQVGFGIERLGEIDFLASFWQRNSYRAGFYYRQCGVKDMKGNELTETGVTLGTTIPLKSFSNALLFGFQYFRRGDFGENGGKENVFRISFGFTGLEQWGKKRGYY